MESLTITANDLPLWGARPYHILTEERDLAPFVVLCGEQHRAAQVAGMFLSNVREIGNQKRGIVGYIGQTASGVWVAVWGTGMGLSTTCIVMYEMLSFAALKEQEGQLVLREASEIMPMSFIRLGTCGAWGTPPIGTAMITQAAVHQGALPLYTLDAPGEEFLDRERASLIRDELRRGKLEALRARGILEADVPTEDLAFPVHVYKASSTLVDAMRDAAAGIEVPAMLGNTMSCDGFFEAQSRGWGPFQTAVPRMIEALNENAGVENGEMEVAEILRRVALWNTFARLRGLPLHRASAVCAAIANRGGDTFSGEDEKRQAVDNSARVLIAAIEALTQ